MVRPGVIYFKNRSINQAPLKHSHLEDLKTYQKRNSEICGASLVVSTADFLDGKTLETDLLNCSVMVAWFLHCWQPE